MQPCLIVFEAFKNIETYILLTSLCVQSYMLFFTDVEHKPDVVWPLASLPKISAVSPCTSLIALALQNENIIIWDKYMGELIFHIHVQYVQ